MARVLEFGSMLFLGILLVLAFTHFLNGTFSEWVASKFTTHDLTAPSTGTSTGNTASANTPGGGSSQNKVL